MIALLLSHVSRNNLYAAALWSGTWLALEALPNETMFFCLKYDNEMRSESARAQDGSGIKENEKRGHVKAETSERRGQEETHFMN